MRIIYFILVNLLLILLPIKLFHRSIKETGYRKNIKERFGFVHKNNEKRIWIHCISVGEAIAAKPLIIELLKTDRLIVTCTTASGREQLERMFSEQIKSTKITLSYIPIDHPLVVNLTFKRWCLSEVIFVETDIWPNICSACKKHNIKLSIINARMSHKSFKGYQKLGTFFSDTLCCFDLIAAQYQKDADYFIALGALEEAVNVTGSIKADISFDEKIKFTYESIKNNAARPIWVAASTHAPEEKIILEAHKRILKAMPNALLILVPRHPNRFEEVANLIEQANFNYSKRSSEEMFTVPNNVFLADSVGELMYWLLLSDVVYMGKSLECRGGHNPLEAAFLSKPIISGRAVDNFSDIYNEMDNQGAVLLVDSQKQLILQVLKLLGDDSLCKTMGSNALISYQHFSGALEKTLKLIH